MSMKQNIEKLLSLLKLTSKDKFAKTPNGYSMRERACLLQLCLHKNKVVRLAAAELPLLRDMFIVAMYELERDKAVKLILEPKFEAAVSKRQQYSNTVATQADEIKELKRKLKLAIKK